jgi:hypothetical protein
MTTLSFALERRPFPRWWGPFSPARGTYSGFRFHQRRLGTWVENERGREFRPLLNSPGAMALARTVLDEWDGGRVLLLPNGLVIKPLQGDHEVGRRVVISRFQGAVVLERLKGGVFDLSNPGQIAPGAPWPGPKTTGLECAIQPDGSLASNWYHPTMTGHDEVRESLHAPDLSLGSGFRRARPNDRGGRVRVTANGHVITNRQEWDGGWVSLYVGRIPPSSWPHRNQWIGGEHS